MMLQSIVDNSLYIDCRLTNINSLHNLVMYMYTIDTITEGIGNSQRDVITPMLFCVRGSTQIEGSFRISAPLVHSLGKKLSSPRTWEPEFVG